MTEVLYGRGVVLEAIRAQTRRIDRVLLAEGVRIGGTVDQIVQKARESKVPVCRVPRVKLDEVAGDANHQGLAIEVGPYPYVDLADVLNAVQRREEPPFLLLLDCVQDPQNLGVLLRTADAVGVHSVIIPRRRSASSDCRTNRTGRPWTETRGP